MERPGGFRAWIGRAAAAVLLALLGAAGSWGAAAPPGRPSPGATVVAFYLAVNQGRYPEARGYLTPEFLRTFVRDGEDLFEKAMEGQVEVGGEPSERMRGNIRQVKVLSSKVEGFRARVIIFLDKRDGKSRKERFELLLRGGVWLIDAVTRPD